VQPTPVVDDWRRFGDRRFRVYHYLALTQGVVGVLSGFDVIIPFALAIGCPPAVAVLLGVLPLLGGMAQLVVPRLLGRTNGNLRGLTTLLAVVSEPRGLWFVALVALTASGLLGGALAIFLLAVLITISSVVSSVVGANLLAWHSAVLPEADRRLVVPRLMAVSLAVGALLLLPLAAVLDTIAHYIGLLAYAIPFGISGAFGLAEIAVLARLRHPGRVVVPARAIAADSAVTPEFNRFVHVSVLNALGMGFAPAMSVYIISVVGLSAGFSMMVGSIGTLTMVVAAAAAGAWLAHGSAETMLRQSFAVRAVAMVCPLFALPGSVIAPIFLVSSSMLAAIGFAEGSLAANERLFRLIRGPAVIHHHAHFLARTSGAMTVGQLASAGVVALGGSFGYPAFALLYLVSSGMRVVAFRRAKKGPGIHARALADAAAPVRA
jgi:hypothetical protein